MSQSAPNVTEESKKSQQHMVNLPALPSNMKTNTNTNNNDAVSISIQPIANITTHSVPSVHPTLNSEQSLNSMTGDLNSSFFSNADI